MTAFARIVRFDKRGTGMSGRPPGIPRLPMSGWQNALAAMDAAGLSRTHVFGWSEGGPLGVMVAAAYPERVQSLILYGTQARFTRRDDRRSVTSIVVWASVAPMSMTARS